MWIEMFFKNIFFLLALVILTFISDFFRIQPSEFIPIWLPSGLMLALLFHNFKSYALSTVMFVLLSSLFFRSSANVTVVAQVILGLGILLELFICYKLVNEVDVRFCHSSLINRALRLFSCCIISPLISTLIAYLSLKFSYYELYTFYIAQVLGLSLALPFIFIRKEDPLLLVCKQLGIPILGMICSFVIFIFYKNYEEDDHNDKYLNQKEKIKNSLIDNIEHNTHLIKLFSHYMAINHDKSFAKFDAYAKLIISRESSLSALEYAPRVTHRERKEREDYMRSIGFENFVITERDMETKELITSLEKDFYYPVYYLYPHLGNEAALGFDLYSNQSRRKSILECIENQSLVTTEPIQLVQSKSQESSVLIFAPVQNSKTDCVLGVFRISSLLNSIMTHGDFNFVGVSLIDNKAKKTLFSKDDLDQLKTDEVLIDIGLRQWQLNLHHSPVFKNTILTSAWTFLCGSTLFFVLLAMYTVDLHNNKREVELLIQQRTQELQDAKELAEKASKVKSEFLANMSHEIRTPVTAIKGYSEMIMNKNLCSGKGKDYLTVIVDSSEFLLTIINDILEVSRVEAGKLRVNIHETDPFEILKEVNYIINNGEYEVPFELEISYPLPTLIAVDDKRLMQILINLCNNALKFTKVGHVKLLVSYRERQIFFAVEDTGVGISQDNLKQIFDPFKQVDGSMTRNYGGAGLGLAITKNLAEMMGGDIHVESILGKGSTFTFALPVPGDVDLIYQSCPSIDDCSRIVPDQNLEVSGLRVLLVEDNNINQMLIETILEEMGTVVTTCSNGKEAIDVINEDENSFDIVLMDIQMPVMDGMTALRILREQGYKKTIIALTANCSEEDKNHCLQNGFDMFLSKPIESSKLRIALHSVKK